MAETKVLPCDCTSAFLFRVKCGGTKSDLKPTCPIPFINRENGAKSQDDRYGKGLRLHNVCKVKGKTVAHCCTVCGKRKVV